MKNRIEFYEGLNSFAPGWQEVMPKIEAEMGRKITAQEWADEQWRAYQTDSQFRWIFDQVTGGQGVFVA